MAAQNGDDIKRVKTAMDPGRLRKLIDSPSPVNATREVRSFQAPSPSPDGGREGADAGNVVEPRALRDAAVWEAPGPCARCTRERPASAWDASKQRALQERTPGDARRARTPSRREHARRARTWLIAPSCITRKELYLKKKLPTLWIPQVALPVMTTKEGVAHAAEIVHAPIPHAVLLHEGLLTPPQRRERLEFETAFHHARRALQRADNNERRRQQLIVSRHSTCDVTGTAQVAPNEPSRVRGEPFKPDLLSHDMQVRDQHKYREFARKADAMNPRLNHHERIFNETPVEWNPQRAQHLRNEGEGGRSFDIVNGGVIAYLPPTIAEKTHVRQAHPSVIVHPYVR